MAKKEAKQKKDKKQKHFFKDFKAEIKKVIWPTPKQLVNTTVAIVTMVVIVAVIVFVLDIVFDMFNKYALTNLQEVVQTIDNGENNAETESIDNETTNTEATDTNSEEQQDSEEQQSSEDTTGETENQENAEVSE